MLPRVIPAWKAMSDSIFYFDTGSTDRTLQVAHERLRPSDAVGRIRWTDFGDTLTRAMDHASLYCDWLLRLDADELVMGDLLRLKKWMEGLEALGGLPGLVALYEGEVRVNWRSRLFRWRDGWKYRYAIDPQPLPPTGVSDGVLVPEGLLVTHHLRFSTRASSLERNERYVERRCCDPHVPPDELDHYEHVLEICGGGE